MVLEGHSADKLRPHANALIPAVIACASEDWYKVIAVLRVIQHSSAFCADYCRRRGSLVWQAQCQLRQHRERTAWPMFDATLSRLSQNDIDQEIKECAIHAVGALVAHFGDSDSLSVSSVWPLVQTRLRNEVTRIATLSALRRIAESPLDTSMAVSKFFLCCSFLTETFHHVKNKL